MDSRNDAEPWVLAADWVTRLREARMEAGHTQEILAESAGVEVATLSSWETGRRIPSLRNLLKVGRALQLRLVVVESDGAVRVAKAPAVVGESGENDDIRALVAVLREARQRSRKTLDALAAGVGVSAWSLAQFERSQLHPRLIVLASWALELGCVLRWQPIV
ncbi:transcriptional regulator [Actinospica durhamensis]|uniref:Transcriptional regulator n=2 Tax=Actinospica durhamensis TaxID=1508375 RepID=A0A941EUS3_9ACTN|nr:transcriptional regulator [Actinospica durhamensis]